MGEAVIGDLRRAIMSLNETLGTTAEGRNVTKASADDNLSLLKPSRSLFSKTKARCQLLINCNVAQKLGTEETLLFPHGLHPPGTRV